MWQSAHALSLTVCGVRSPRKSSRFPPDQRDARLIVSRFSYTNLFSSAAGPISPREISSRSSPSTGPGSFPFPATRLPGYPFGYRRDSIRARGQVGAISRVQWNSEENPSSKMLVVDFGGDRSW